MQKINKQISTIFIASCFLIVLTACQGKTVAQDDDPLRRDITGEINVVSDPGKLSEGSQWPSEIPKILPPLDAPIDSVMAGATHVRIFYSNVPVDVFQEYLGRLKAAGCTLEAVVYNSNPTSDENARKRAARGEYDAIYTSLGDLDLRMEVNSDWNGIVTYDIDGLSRDQLSAIDAPDWPEAWTSLVPQPAGCTLIRPSIMEASETRLMVLCNYVEKPAEEQLTVYKTYLQILLDLGYQIENQPPEVTLATPLTLTKDAVSIDLDPNAGGSLMINAKK
jgi:hypothetical protein